ncbi:hypothetical protein [Paracraurococcus ruber]|nr:hypothetical protein [Paracraurococcus ruber]TDG27262.1 hypothetical protein E2C05_23460 [Paracraurococcus ruber]
MLLLLPAGARAQGRQMRPGAARLLGPARAQGALVWAHQHYLDGPPPDPPPFLDRLLGQGWDPWRLDRLAPAAPGQFGLDPLEAGAAALAAGTAALRLEGYRQVLVVGESRGAFITLVALRQAGLAEAVLLLAPAAHGSRPERRPQALAEFRAACAAAVPGAVRRAGLVLFQDDPYDPDPAARAAAFAEGMARCGAAALVIDRPPQPIGHGAAGDPEFDALFGARLAGFLAG